jgi:hypothetical protein
MVRVIAASVLLAASTAMAQEPVKVYTNDDLDRMFGPPPPPVSEPVDKSGPEDWGWVEGYLERQYARIDADRQYELDKRVVDIAEERTYTGSRYGYGYYGGYAAFGLRYPASVWHQNVSRIYRGGSYYGSRGSSGCKGGNGGRAMGRPSPRAGRMK